MFRRWQHAMQVPSEIIHGRELDRTPLITLRSDKRFFTCAGAQRAARRRNRHIKLDRVTVVVVRRERTEW